MKCSKTLINGDTFSISALHLSIKVPYFSNSGHKNEKVTSYLSGTVYGAHAGSIMKDQDGTRPRSQVATIISIIPCCKADRHFSHVSSHRVASQFATDNVFR
eukprot:SAG31_NODE_244_length_19246_cov_20.233823_5_plen_102_part_00